MTGRILEGPKLKSAVPKKSLGQLYFENAARHGDKICQVDGTTNLSETYSSVKQRSTRVALALQAKGITSKDVIAFCSFNTLDVTIPMLAAFYLGAKVTNLEPTLSPGQMQHLLCLTTPTIIFAEETVVGLIEASLKAANCQAAVIVYGHSEKYQTLSQLTVPHENEDTFSPTAVDLNEIALFFFSSGTTGLPKAICHTHNSFIHIGCTLRDYDLGKTVLHFNCFYWITAHSMMLTSFLVGGIRVSFHSMDAEAIFKMVEKYKVDEIFMNPVLSNALTSFEGAINYNTSSVRTIHCAGSPVSMTQYQNISTVFENADIVRVYGMTEVSVLSMFHPDLDKEFIKAKPFSCGTLMYEIRLKIVDTETNEVLGPNQKGEIRVRSPCLMQGYYKTDSAYVFDEDGFLKTGDVGYYDDDETLYFVERIKEMFKYRAWHVVPSALEAILLTHPGVKEAVVFGVPCGEDGEAPTACVVLKSGAVVTEAEIEELVAKNVPDRERLRGGVHFMPSLSRTPTGKVMRKEIREAVIKSL